MGRASLYTEEIAEEICRRIAEGETLKEICRDESFPHESTVRSWVLDDRQGFSTRYARARELQLECWAEEIQEIGDDGNNDWMARLGKEGQSIGWQLNGEHVQRSTLRVNNRKWLLSKLKPERYGDSLNLTGSLDVNHKTDDQLNARLAQLLSEKGSDSDPGGAGQTE